MENLDMKCAELGQKVASAPDVTEKILTDALCVLEEQGLYAAFLYLKARCGRGGEAIYTEVDCFLKRVPGSAPLATESGDVLTSIKALSQDLDSLLLARDLVRHALVYARYHVKARS